MSELSTYLEAVELFVLDLIYRYGPITEPRLIALVVRLKATPELDEVSKALNTLLEYHLVCKKEASAQAGSEPGQTDYPTYNVTKQGQETLKSHTGRRVLLRRASD